MSDFSSDIRATQRPWDDIFKEPKEKKNSTRILYSEKKKKPTQIYIQRKCLLKIKGKN